MKEINIDFDPNGNATIEASGFEGSECKELTRDIEEALGSVERVKEKPEMKRGKKELRKAGA